MPEPEIRLREKHAGVLSVLEVRTPRRRSSLETVRGLLFEMRIQIVRAESIVEEEGLLESFHIVEFDGAPIGKRRAATVRSAVRRALREAARADEAAA
jgi:UTP:GlnB (protein PII) uridylyltransferase